MTDKWTTIEPGLIELEGTHITIKYDINTQEYQVHWYSKPRKGETAQLLDYTKILAKSWLAECIAMGYIP